MQIIETNNLSADQKEDVMQLWNNEYPKQLKFLKASEFDLYLNGLNKPLHVLALNIENRLMGWAFLFERNNEKWFAVIIDHNAQNKGLGTRLLNVLKEKEPTLNGWVIDHERYVKEDGAIYHSPMPFYLKNSFIVRDKIRLETDKLSAVKIVWLKINESEL